MSQKPFSLPEGVSFDQETLPQGGLAYVFRHNTLGKLGRLLVIPHGAQSHISCEVAGDEKDPMTQKRLEIFKPIADTLTNALASTYGKGKEAPLPQVIQEPKQWVESKVLVCLTCEAPVALLIFAKDAYSPDALEDHARLMYAHAVEMNLPTWVIGAEESLTPKEGKALVLKLLPRRESIRPMRSNELNPIFDVLQKDHCAPHYRR